MLVRACRLVDIGTVTNAPLPKTTDKKAKNKPIFVHIRASTSMVHNKVRTPGSVTSLSISAIMMATIGTKSMTRILFNKESNVALISLTTY